MGSVPAFDVLEDLPPGVGEAPEGGAVDQLAFQDPEGTITQRVVAGISDRPHGRPDTGLLAPLPEGHRRELGALAATMDHLGRLSPRNGHVQRVEDEFGLQVAGHRPSDHPAAPSAGYHRQVEEAGCGGHGGDIGHPQPVRRAGLELSLHQIRRRMSVSTPCGPDTAPRAHSLEAGLPH